MGDALGRPVELVWVPWPLINTPGGQEVVWEPAEVQKGGDLQTGPELRLAMRW